MLRDFARVLQRLVLTLNKNREKFTKEEMVTRTSLIRESAPLTQCQSEDRPKLRSRSSLRDRENKPFKLDYRLSLLNRWEKPIKITCFIKVKWLIKILPIYIIPTNRERNVPPITFLS